MKLFPSLFVLLALALISQSASAQKTGDWPKLKHDAGRNLSGIFDSEELPNITCSKDIKTLRLMRIKFDERDAVDTIYSLIFADSKGRREEYPFTVNFRWLNDWAARSRYRRLLRAHTTN